ncbi:pyruvate carboxylase subunit B, partial [bacterium]|nr:pyruvate carboxylase subunit B [bacterium]
MGIRLHDQTLRDAHQSILATRMRTEDMLPIAEEMDKVGFFSMEVWGGATFDVPIRYLNQDPWERLNLLKEKIKNTPLQMLERAMNIVAYRNFPDDVVEKFIYFAKKNGCDNFRIFDALNDIRNMEVPIKSAIKVGGHVQGSLCYTISPVHTVERFVQDFQKLERLGCHSLCIKDMAGMISPTKAYDIISGCKKAGIRIPIDLHSHTTSGMTGMSYMKAAEAGVDILDGSMSPLSGGTGQPPIESIVAALKGTEYDTGYDLDHLIELRKYFLKIWDKYSHLHRETAMKVDPSVTVHQIPGGMLSNLLLQLEQQGAGDKYLEVLEETPRVRKDMGYPPLVTPTSQVVGVQAVMNVLFGRYKKIPEQTKNYVRGMYGLAPGEISEEIKELVLGKDWKDQVIDCRPADLLEPEYEKRREELKSMGLMKKEEDVLTYTIYPEVGLKFLKGEIKPEFTSDQLPLKSQVVVPKTPSAAQPVPTPAPGAGTRSYKVEVDGTVYAVRVQPAEGVEISQSNITESAVEPKSKPSAGL